MFFLWCLVLVVFVHINNQVGHVVELSQNFDMSFCWKIMFWFVVLTIKVCFGINLTETSIKLTFIFTWCLLVMLRFTGKNKGNMFNFWHAVSSKNYVFCGGFDWGASFGHHLDRSQPKVDICFHFISLGVLLN